MNARVTKVFVVGALGVAGCVGTVSEKTGSNAEDISICSSTMVEGIDVSYYDGTVNWASVKSSGRQFAIARVSDGTGFMDPKFAANWSGIKAVGMVRGVYQFFRPEDDAVAQANIVVSAVGSLGPGDLPPVLDVEVTDGESSATIVAGIKTWANEIRTKLGVEPMIYCSPGFWDGISGTGSIPATYLWDANWGVSCPALPTTGTWSGFDIWQYSATGSVPGITDQVDLDRFNGTLAELLAFAGGSGGGGTDAGGGGSGGTDGGSSGTDGGSGGTDGGAGDSGSGGTDGGGGSSPDSCSEGPGFCTATLQCDKGHWIIRQDDSSACTTVENVEEPCSVGDGYCTETLQCDSGHWVARKDDPAACTSGPGA